MSRETVMGATARIYALAGMVVFPLWWSVRGGFCACPVGQQLNAKGTGPACSRAKHPLIPTGVNGASDDLDQVAEWWDRWPWANIGLPAGGNGLAIIDVDPAHGGRESWERLCQYARTRGIELWETQRSVTGSGGLHAIYAAPAGEHAAACGGREGCQGCIKNGQGNRPPFGSDMPGLDTRGHGGYIVAPPSRHASGREYEWMNFGTDPAPWPRLLTALMYPPAPPAAATRSTSTRGDRPTSSSYGRAALDGELAQLTATLEGGRNAQLNNSAVKLGGRIAAGYLDEQLVRDELLTAALSIGLGESEARATINSGLRAGMRNPRQAA